LARGPVAAPRVVEHRLGRVNAGDAPGADYPGKHVQAYARAEADDQDVPVSSGCKVRDRRALGIAVDACHDRRRQPSGHAVEGFATVHAPKHRD